MTDDATPEQSASNVVPEPPAATHQAEDETWDTGGEDAPHKLDAAEALEAKVKELEAELAAANDKALRARADYQNLVRRTEEQQNEAGLRATARIVTKLLDSYETLERAVADIDAAGVDKDDPRSKGLHMSFEGMRRVLEAEGLEPVPGVGEPFDLKVHQAVAQEPSEHPADTVAEVIRPGYTLGGKLLRESLVKVSSGPADA